METPGAEKAPRAKPPPADLPTGTEVGRFVLEHSIGAGGMGVVYAARDPQLGRRVAIKLLRGAGSPASRVRLLREAQAMARLAHPNVVVVHEAGEHGQQLFVAMELVEGTSLDVYLRRQQPGWRAVLDLYLQAGRGLAAAHRAGIVHRDFKPSNVLVGDDGRVRVGDFGLAREDGESGEVETARFSPLSSSEMTETGTVLGTPAYMAPEQGRGERVGQPADLYSFCVALYEGLCGVRPGSGNKPRRKVPRAIQRVLRRGLAGNPAARPASMDVVLDALVAARRRRPIVPLALAGAVVVAAALLVVRQRSRVPGPCDDLPARLGGIWDPERKAALQARFVQSGLPGAEARWRRVAEIVDGYAASWVARQRAACAVPLRRACLDARLEKLRAWVGVMSEADAAAVKNAVDAAVALDSLRACEEAAPFVAPMPDDPALAAKVRELRNQISALDVRAQVGDQKAAAEGVPRLQQAARALGYKPLEAELMAKQAKVLMNTGDFAAALPVIEELRRLAEELRYDRMRALAWVELVRIHAWMYKPAEAHRAARDAEAVMKPMSGEDVQELRTHLASAEADAYWDERRFPEAIALATTALEGAERLHGKDSVVIVPRLVQMGSLLHLANRLDEASAAFARGLAILEAGGAGDDNALVAIIMGNLGDVAGTRRDWAAARGWFERAQPRFEKIYGPDGLTPAKNLVGLAWALARSGHAADALAPLERARAVLERKLPPGHPERGELYAALGGVLVATGDLRGARGWLEQAVAIKERGGDGEDPARLAAARFELAQALWVDPRERARARELAVAARGAIGGEDQAQVDRWLAEKEQKAPMILVGQYDSPYVRRVAISLQLMGLPFARNTISGFADAEAMRRINPLGRIPSLILDDGEVLIDSAAILDHLEEIAAPGARLLPPSGRERRQALRIMSLATGCVDKAGAIVYERSLRPPEKVHLPWIERCRVQLDSGLAALEEMTPVAGWFLDGDRPMQPDITAGCMLGYLAHRFPEALSGPRLEAFLALMEGLEPFRATAPAPDEAMPAAPL